MTADQTIDLIARYHHLLALESARLVKSGFVEAWVNSLDEECWALIHRYLEVHKEIADSAASDLRPEPAPTVGAKGA